MYSYIKGKVAIISDGSITVENNGIGYLFAVSGNTLAKAKFGEEITLYSYLQVKEDLLALYGFATMEEKQFFEKLISISGIGPKLAMQTLSGLDLKSLAVAIATGDTKTLSTIKGLGKKTAERIVLELREKFNSEIVNKGDVIPFENVVASNSDLDDAVFALCSLGVSKTDAMTIASKAIKEVSGLENIIAYCLKKL